MDTGYEQMEEERIAALIVKLQTELAAATKIIDRYANFDIYKDRSDALNMVAKRFLREQESKQ